MDVPLPFHHTLSLIKSCLHDIGQLVGIPSINFQQNNHTNNLSKWIEHELISLLANVEDIKSYLEYKTPRKMQVLK